MFQDVQHFGLSSLHRVVGWAESNLLKILFQGAIDPSPYVVYIP